VNTDDFALLHMGYQPVEVHYQKVLP